MACFDIASAAIGADVDVLLYDLDPDTLAPDPAHATSARADSMRQICRVIGDLQACSGSGMGNIARTGESQ